MLELLIEGKTPRPEVLTQHFKNGREVAETEEPIAVYIAQLEGLQKLVRGKDYRI